MFGILNFGFCDLFGICVLVFEIFKLLKPNVPKSVLSDNTHCGSQTERMVAVFNWHRCRLASPFFRAVFYSLYSNERLVWR